MQGCLILRSGAKDMILCVEKINKSNDTEKTIKKLMKEFDNL